jgi:hypothetical protein
MATGALDANGIWIYGEDDSEPTFSGLLNKLGDSTSDAVGTLATDIASLEERPISGLVPVIPSSVNVASGTASVSSSGIITLTSATVIDINGIFSSQYENYKILYSGFIVGSPQNLQTRFRNAGTAAGGDTATNSVMNQIFASEVTAPSRVSLTGQTSTATASVGSSRSVFDATIYAPFLAVNTLLTSNYSYHTSGTQSEWGLMGGRKGVGTSWTGISFSGGTHTATIRIYGMN